MFEKKMFVVYLTAHTVFLSIEWSTKLDVVDCGFIFE